MNFTILIIGAAILISLIAMITMDVIDEQNDLQRSEKLESQLEKLQMSFESKQKKNIVFLNLGEEQ
tara:strand:+ start:531 stop:728 length:198 start_codon:yes stop_codon:yes gene_type:complete